MNYLKIFTALRILAGLIFMASGFLKLMQPYQNFLAVIQSYEIIHGPMADLLARTIPWAEFLAGMLLILGLWTAPAAIVLWFLNSAFVALLSAALFMKIPIGECGCFGDSLSLTPAQMLVFDIVLWFVFFALVLFKNGARCWSLDRHFSR